MKSFGFIIVVLAVFGSMFAVNAQDGKTGKSKFEEVVFKVNMTCHNCQAKIEKNIPWEKGVKDLSIDLEKKIVKIQYDRGKTSEAKLEQAIKKLGFTCAKDEPKRE